MDINTIFFDEFPVEENIKQIEKQTKQEKEQIKQQRFKEHQEKKRKLKQQKDKKQRYEKLQEFKTQEEKNQYIQEQKQIKIQRKLNGQQALQSKYKVVIDCAYEINMGPKQQRSLARQIFELYTENRRVKYPINLYITNVYQTLQQYLNEFNSEKWPIHFDERPFYEIQELQNIVYLSPDAEEEIKEIREDEIYVIGGLVDKVVIKNASLNRAKMTNVRAAKLPISQYIKPNYKKCLNVSTAALMIPFWLECRDWEQTFERIVPAKFKEKESGQQLMQI